MQSDSRLLFDDEFDDTTNEIAGEGTLLTVLFKRQTIRSDSLGRSNFVKLPLEP